VKLSSLSGEEVWRAAWPSAPEPANGDYVQDLLLDGAGDVIVTGSSNDSATVGKFSSASGEALWFRTLARSRDPLEDQVFADAAVLDENDDPIVAASVLRSKAHMLRLHLIGFAENVAGERVVIRDDGTRRTVQLVLRDPRIQPAVAGGAGDPRIEGASFALAGASGGTLAFSLPSESWTPLGTPGGFRYSAEAGGHGCTLITVKPGVLRARCATSDGGLTLAEPLGGLSVRLAIGAPHGLLQCAAFGGTVLSDRARTPGSPGRFEALDAPAPADCD
jgi:hypothetical protein